MMAEARGRGYATEALRAALAWRFESTTTVAMIDAPNVASVRVAEKCGYHATPEASYRGSEVLLFSNACRGSSRRRDHCACERATKYASANTPQRHRAHAHLRAPREIRAGGQITSRRERRLAI